MEVINRLNILRVVFLHCQWEKGGRWGEEESSEGGIIFLSSFRSVNKLLYILSSLVPALHFS